MKFYFSSFVDNGGTKNYLRPNKNCNLTSWVSGCEPGWACRAGKNQKINLQDSKTVPYRTVNCRPCCPGFFCPHGITCMIRKFSYHSFSFTAVHEYLKKALNLICSKTLQFSSNYQLLAINYQSERKNSNLLVSVV